MGMMIQKKIQKLMDEHPFDLISIVGGDGTINITLQAPTPILILPPAHHPGRHRK